MNTASSEGANPSSILDLPATLSQLRIVPSQPSLATAAVRAAKDAGVKHFVWSTLPNAEAISGGKFHLPHFTGKAKVDGVVKEAGLQIIHST